DRRPARHPRVGRCAPQPIRRVVRPCPGRTAVARRSSPTSLYPARIWSSGDRPARPVPLAGGGVAGVGRSPPPRPSTLVRAAGRAIPWPLRRRPPARPALPRRLMMSTTTLPVVDGGPPAGEPTGRRGEREGAIRAGVLGALGRPAGLFRVAVVPLSGDHFRVN